MEAMIKSHGLMYETLLRLTNSLDYGREVTPEVLRQAHDALSVASDIELKLLREKPPEWNYLKT